MRPSVVLFYFLLIMSEGFETSNKPRRSVSFQEMNVKQFEESGFGGLSSLMMRDDIGQLVIGARGKVLTLSLDDITKKTSEAKWLVSSADKALCQMKGKDMKDCDNFIRTLHTMKDGKMLVCGTNAFNPACDHVIFKNGKLSLEGKKQVGKGKVPFDPYERFASLMDGNTLYSAVSSNFLGTEVLFQRHGLNPLKTEMKRSWFNEPTMISISLVETSKNSDSGEDDNVFLFFTESAVEERHDNIRVSRIARVCKSDLGGERTLQKRWTSFLKARLDCQFGDGGLPTLVQDVFLLRDLNNESVFYATLTSGSESSGGCSKSAVCAYKLSDITQVFSGRFLTERESGRWDTYTGEEPFPHPGSCINNEMRANGVTTSLDLSDKTLLFVKNHPLMEGVVTPMTGKPLLVQTGTRFSKIIVDQVTSLDGRQRQVMLIGTDSGWLQKAVRFDGEDVHVIEELQLFRTPQPVDFLQLASKTGQLYSGTSNIAVQVDVRDCSRYTSCNDCLLSRDPYCGWDKIRGQCASVVGASTGSMIQSLSDGDITMCPTSGLKKKPAIVHITVGIAQFLRCSPSTNLLISWRFSDNILPPGPRHTVLSQGLIIRPSYSDAGLYTCETLETVKGKVHRETVVRYLVRVQDTNTLVSRLKAAAITLALLVVSLILIMCRRIICRKAKKQNNIDCGNENSNNNQETTVRPPCHHDQTKDRCMDEGRVQCGHGSDDVT
ncbi:semaphorin-4E-like isoform X2 [Seriola aureovittata]|nr:semaphorin-4E-like isoform X2 [Seriola aureovittata]XP_056249216.1 semaphorin-4E-like isoform X2 [Seriola aureovittata]XP_056249217.1 semaphorin-4E-like isoform X2 [Seriola aureovittata]XP_056249218.1 semaphorin-4E-like isoform X2 [Seriola aureovittata]